MLLVLPGGHTLGSRADVTLRDAARERWIAGCARCRWVIPMRTFEELDTGYGRGLAGTT